MDAVFSSTSTKEKLLPLLLCCGGSKTCLVEDFWDFYSRKAPMFGTCLAAEIQDKFLLENFQIAKIFLRY